MKYFIVSETGLVIECHRITDLALEMETLSLMEGYPVQPVPRRRDARDSGWLESQFMRSAKRQISGSAASSP